MGTSYKELVREMKSKYTIKEVQSFKIADCYGGEGLLLYYLNKNFGVKRLYNIDERPLKATHIFLTNRAFIDVINNPLVGDLVDDKGIMLTIDMERIVRIPGVKTTCFSKYNGKDQVIVSRGGAKFSSFRKLDK